MNKVLSCVSVEFEIYDDGDMTVSFPNRDDVTVVMDASELPELRDWLNKHVTATARETEVKP